MAVIQNLEKQSHSQLRKLLHHVGYVFDRPPAGAQPSGYGETEEREGHC